MPGTSTLKRASSSGTPIASATTTSVIAAPGSGKQLRIKRIIVSNGSATGTWTSFKENSGTTCYPAYLTQGATVTIVPTNWALTANKAFEMVTSAAGSVEYTVEYEVVTL